MSQVCSNTIFIDVEVIYYDWISLFTWRPYGLAGKDVKEVKLAY